MDMRKTCSTGDGLQFPLQLQGDYSYGRFRKLEMLKSADWQLTGLRKFAFREDNFVQEKEARLFSYTNYIANKSYKRKYAEVVLYRREKRFVTCKRCLRELG